MADDEDAIYIDVIPRVDEGAADSALDKLKDKFKDVAPDLGKGLSDALNDSGILEGLGTKLGEALSEPLKGISDTLGVDLKNPLEKLVKQDLSGALDDVVGQLGTKLGSVLTSPLKGVADTLGVDLDSAISKALNKDYGGLGAELGKGIGGKIASGLGLDDALGDFGGLQGVQDHIQNITSGLQGLKGFKGGNIAGGLGGVQALLGEADQLGLDNEPHSSQSVLGKVGGVLGSTVEFGGLGAAVGSVFPGPGNVIGGAIGGAFGLGKGVYDAVTGPSNSTPSNLQNVPDTGVLGSAGSAGSPSASSTTANEVEVKANDAVISAGNVVLGGSISIPAGAVASSSSPVRPSSATSGGALGTGAGAAPTLRSSGGGGVLGNAGAGHFSQGGVIPGDSPGYDNTIGSLPGGGMVGLEGGEGIINPSAMQRPGVGNLIASLNQHYDEGTGAGGVGGDPNNTTLAQPPTQGNSAGGDASGGGKQQPLGTGSGGGISGGGLIGAAEQAGVAAAGIAGFGGGAIAAQVAEQEINLATQKSSQIAGALAAAPFETLGLSGGQLGAPTVNPLGGWVGKIIGGVIGQQTQLPNLAQGTQQPKQPTQKQPGDLNDPANDPGNGTSPNSPAGTKEDPMHVNIANPAPQQPQNAATSSAALSANLATGIGAVA